MAQRIAEFDLWQPGYGNAVVTVYVAGTTTPADVYEDEALTTPADNPQTLTSKVVDGVDYGKFVVPLYTASAYELSIDGIDETGIQRPPLTTLDGADASDATVTPDNGNEARSLAARAGDEIWAEDQGEIGTSSATNTSTLTAAIAAASAIGGGSVLLPEGQITFNQITLPAGVVLVGRGKNATALQSQVADKAITISGDGAGFKSLTIDGVNLQVGSIGVYSEANDQTVFDTVLIKRFETGLHCKGGRYNDWWQLSIDNCTDGAKLHGDTASGDGDQWRNNRWMGGLITTCTGTGLELSYEDTACSHNEIHVGFESNTGTGLKINGARHLDLRACWWSGNTINWAIQDDSLTSVTDNDVIGVHFLGGEVEDGNATFTGRCQDVLLDGLELISGTYTLTLVDNAIAVVDCVEGSELTVAGADGLKWVRQSRATDNPPASFGVTTDATVTNAWTYHLEPGEVINVRCVVVARQRNGTGYAAYHIARNVRRPGSDLAYDGQTANFTLGDILTGATSGATGRIIADSDSGATGTLTLMDIVGTFQDNEAIAGALGGAALVNGTISDQNAALLGSTTSIQAAIESDAAWACDFAVSAGDVHVQVTGAASKTIEWTVGAEVQSTS